MKNLPLIEVTELIKGIESSDNFHDVLSIELLFGSQCLLRGTRPPEPTLTERKALPTPNAKILTAALTSLSWTIPHAGHVQERISNVKAS